MQNGLKIVKVGFLLPLQKEWMGGVNYFKTLFSAIHCVNEHSEDGVLIKPYIFRPKDEDLAKEFSKYAEFINIKRSKKIGYYIKKIYKALLFKKFNKQKYMVETYDPALDLVSHSVTNQNIVMLPWIPDFQHIHLPEMFSKEEVKIRDESFKKQIDVGKFVLLSSKDALKDFNLFAPDKTFKARVLHFVSNINPDIYSETDRLAKDIKEKYKLPNKYFYVPNQFWQHKNHKIVFEAISLLKQKGVNIKVVFTGYSADYRNEKYFSQLMNYADETGIRDNIKVLGLVDSIDVYFLMRNCVSIINPSLFEGWSSTVEEAKSLGKNIILSNLNVHKEQNPPCAIYFDPHKPQELADIMLDKWNSSNGGPDEELEQMAKTNLPKRMLDFGETYKKIVLEAME